jgi:hypothetical protein
MSRNPRADNHGAALVIKDEPHAPLVFFDAAPVYSTYNHMVSITLSVSRTLPDREGGVTTDNIAIAYLRTNLEGATALRNSLDKALLLAAETEGEAN